MEIGENLAGVLIFVASVIVMVAIIIYKRD